MDETIDTSYAKGNINDILIRTFYINNKTLFLKADMVFKQFIGDPRGELAAILTWISYL